MPADIRETPSRRAAWYTLAQVISKMGLEEPSMTWQAAHDGSTSTLQASARRVLPTRTALFRQRGLALQRQVLGLQRLHGNRYVGDLFTRLPTPREPVPVVHHWTGSLLRQATSAAASQPNIPQELLASVNLRALDNGELRSRHDRIIAILSRSLSSTVECELLLEGVGDIGVEVARRQALEAGRTFPQTAIDAMRAYFVSNAQSASPDVCIVALNKGMRLVLADPTQKMGSDIASSMAKLQASGRVEASLS